MTELLRGFKQDVEGLLRQLELSCSCEDYSKIPDLMHTLKGAAVGVGAKQLALRCADVDRVAIDGGPVHVKAASSDIRACFDETVLYLNEYVQRQHQESL